jgi:hypothetical protein
MSSTMGCSWSSGTPSRTRAAACSRGRAKDDVAGLRGALERALAGREDWAGLGARGRALVEAEFDWPRLAGRYLDFYRSLRWAGGGGGERTMLYSAILEQQG